MQEIKLNKHSCKLLLQMSIESPPRKMTNIELNEFQQEGVEKVSICDLYESMDET